MSEQGRIAMTQIESEANDRLPEFGVDAATRLQQLAWVIGSPPLLNQALLPHAALTVAEAAQWWLDWQPATPPLNHVRLGSDFEQLWQYWLCDHPHWQLLVHNLPVREHSRTLGEFDLLVRHRQRDKQEHWELAVKFYLGFGDLDRPASWHGAQFRDRLDHKLDHLRDEQLCWKDRPAGQAALLAAGLAPQRARAIVKGRLCYPLGQENDCAVFAAAGHDHGIWATAEQWCCWLQQQAGEVMARPLARAEWFAAGPDRQWQSLTEILLNAPKPGQRPLVLRLACGERRWPMAFVVPCDWPDRAIQAATVSR